MTTGHEFPRGAYSIALSQSAIREALDYDLETGVFVRKTSNRYGQRADYYDEDKGYMFVFVLGFRVPAHVLAWFYVHGEWRQIDHKDQCKGNNWITNLRPATSAQNAANQGVRITNLLGVKGVQRKNSRYRAYITVNYKYIHLGMFNTIEEAVDARKIAEDRYFGEFKPE
jgi:HNH endonuclease